MVAVVLTGLVVGALHAVTGPDHVSAVVPLTLTDPRRGALTGLAWGAGHGAGVAGLAALAVLLRDWFRIEVAGAWSEAVVGAVLVGMGAWSLARTLQPAEPVATHPVAAFSVGTLHGTAGAAHLVGVVPALTLGAGQAIGWLGALLCGAALAMAGVGASAGALSARTSPAWRTGLARTAGAVAVVVGLAWLLTASLAPPA